MDRWKEHRQFQGFAIKITVPNIPTISEFDVVPTSMTLPSFLWAIIHQSTVIKSDPLISAVRSNEPWWSTMSTIIGIRDGSLTGSTAVATAASAAIEANGCLYSPAKEKAATRGAAYTSRAPLLLRRLRHLLAAAKLRLLLCLCIFCVVVFFTSRLSSLMGWIPHHPSSVSSSSRYESMVFSTISWIGFLGFCPFYLKNLNFGDWNELGYYYLRPTWPESLYIRIMVLLFELFVVLRWIKIDISTANVD